MGKHEVALILTPQMIEDIRRRRRQKIEDNSRKGTKEMQ